LKVWLDDIRPLPEDYDVLMLTGEECIELILTGTVTEISFDHDLGEGINGYEVARKIEELAYFDKIPRIKWHIHTSNPVGLKSIFSAMKSADNSWHSHAAGEEHV